MTIETPDQNAEIAVVVADLLDQLGLTWDPATSGDVHLFDELGMDSFDAYEMIAMLQIAFDLESDDVAGDVDVDEAEGTFDHVFTVSQIISTVAERIAASGR